MKKRIGLIFLVLFGLIFVVECEPVLEEAVESENAGVLEPTYNEDLEEIHEVVQVKHLDDFDLIIKYDTIDYDLNKWRIIDNKTIKISMWTEGLPDNWEAFVEHAHIDMFVKHEDGSKPTIFQDSMDDKYHGIKQDGFVIGDDIVYENIFGIEGLSIDLANVFYRDRTISEYRESDFYRRGYTINSLQAVYDVMVKKPENDYYETISVYDEIIIPVFEGSIRKRGGFN